MAVKVMLKKHRAHNDGTYPVVIYIYANHHVFYKYLDIAVLPTQFQQKQDNWIKNHPDAVLFNSKIEKERREAIERITTDAGYIAAAKPGKLTSLSEYLEKRAAQFKEDGQIDMDRKLRRMKDEVEAMAARKVYFQEINMDWIRSYVTHCKKQGNCHNTIMRKIKNLRTLFNQAKTDNRTSGDNPFNAYKITLEPVNKEKLTKDEIKAIEGVTVTPGTILFHAKNMFLFAFYTHGMRFGNAISLKKSYIKSNILLYQMNKGKKIREINLHPKAIEIVNYYQANNPGLYLFPFMKREPRSREDFINMKGSANALVNAALKTIAELAEISKPLSTHIARHSFAYLLKKSAVDSHIIKDALGHTSMNITETYLADLDDDTINAEVNRALG